MRTAISLRSQYQHKLLLEQSYDSMCQILRIEAERSTSLGFLIREDGILARKAIYYDRYKVFVPKSLRNRILVVAIVQQYRDILQKKDFSDDTPRVLLALTGILCAQHGTSSCVLRGRSNRSDEACESFEIFPAQAPLESVAVDLLGPLPKSKSGLDLF